MRKGWLLAGVFLVILVGGGLGVKSYLTTKIGDEVVRLTQDEDVKKAIDQAIGSSGGSGKINVQDLVKQFPQTASTSTEAKTTAGSGENAALQEGKSTIRPDAAPSQGQEAKDQQSQQQSSTNPAVDEQPVQKEVTQKPTENGLKFNNRDEAVKYAMSRFTAAEIAHYLNEYKNRAKLTPQQKNAIKAEILSRFTAEELRAMQQAASH
jgi:hypothetical protein